MEQDGHVRVLAVPLVCPVLDPVGGFIAGAFESVFFNESFEQVYGMMIDLEPVILRFF